MRILLIEDEIGLAEGIAAVLEKDKYSVDTVHDGLSGLDYALSGIYDVILLDIMLPKLNGLDVLRNLRKESISTPVLLLTAKSEVDDKINGLDAGADDYLTKPFVIGELLARIRALTRRKGDIIDQTLTFGDLSLNRNTNELFCSQLVVKLGLKEYQMMELLMTNPKQIVAKDRIVEKVWGYDDETGYNNVEVYVSFLRKKLNYLHSTVQIITTRGVGYSLEVLHD